MDNKTGTVLTQAAILEVRKTQEKLLTEYTDLVQVINDVHEIFWAKPVFNYNLENAVKSLEIRVAEERDPRTRTSLQDKLTDLKESQISYPDTFNNKSDLDALRAYDPNSKNGTEIELPEVKSLTSQELYPQEERTPTGIKMTVPAFCTKDTFEVPEYGIHASREEERQKIINLVQKEIETNLMDQKIRLANNVPGYWETKKEIEDSLRTQDEDNDDLPTIAQALKNIYDDFNDLDYKGTIDRINYIVFVIESLNFYLNEPFDVPPVVEHKLDFIGKSLDLNYLTGTLTDFEPLVKKLGLSLKQGPDFDLIK